jgi:hypothetical protein
VPRTLLFSGFDVLAPEIPEDARVLLPPIPLPELDDFKSAVQRAIEEPLEGPPLEQLLKPTAHVTVVIDDPSLPVPPVSKDCRREMLEVVLRTVALAGIRASRLTLLVANGLSRAWKTTELADFFGVETTAAYPMTCHDAEASAALAHIGDEPQGPVEVHRALVEADVVIHLNVVSAPAMAGLFGAVHGTSGYRTARWLCGPAAFEGEENPMTPGSAYHRLHERVGALLSNKVRVFQVSAVLNNEVWAPAFAALLRSNDGVSRPLQIWNAMPVAVRHRAARLIKASYRPIAALAGPPSAVAPRALESFYRQHEITTEGEADLLVFGLPDQGPASVRSAQNPILAAQLALGFVAHLSSGKSLLRKDGVLVFANPLAPNFDRRVHAPHEEFYEKVLRLEREPAAIHERFEPSFASRPDFVSAYQRRFAFHGGHPFFAWYSCTPMRRRAARIIVAHGDPRACARLGFTPAADVQEALEKAHEFLGRKDPDTLVLEMPPPFWVRVR